METKEFKCKICGRICKSQHTLNLHTKACEKKNGIKKTEVKVEEITETNTATTKTIEITVNNEPIRETVPGLVQDNEDSILKRIEEIMNHLNSVSTIDIKLKKEIFDIYQKLTGKPAGSLDCPDCMRHIKRVFQANLDKN